MSTIIAPAQLWRAYRSLTNAEIKALPDTAGVGYLQILPAPGAGLRYRIRVATLLIDSTAGGYTGIDAAARIALCYDPAYNDNFSDFVANVATYASVDALLGKSSPGRFAVDLVQTLGVDDPGFGVVSVAYDMQYQENTAICLAGLNGGADFTGGNAANKGLVVIDYDIVPTTIVSP